MIARSLVAALAAAALSCGPTTKPVAGPKPTPAVDREALRGLPPRQDPPLALDDDDDLRRARSLYDAMPVGDKSRDDARRELWRAYEARAEFALGADDRETAYVLFAEAIELWDASELADRTRPPPAIELATPLAKKLYDQFAPIGGDVQAVTALAVLGAADPSRAAEIDKTWLEIAAYVDDLAVAARGEGAQRARPIEILESVTEHFPSPWAGEALAQLYLEREDAIQAALRTGNANMQVLGAHGPGVVVPVWNLIRVYARMDRLADALPAVDKLAGHEFDDPALRRVLSGIITNGATGPVIFAFAQAFMGGYREELLDYPAAERICRYGARLLPQAPEPRQCLGVVAAFQDTLAPAIYWLEEASRLDPANQELVSLLARLYEGRLTDNVFGERLDAARAELARLEALHADAAKRWPGKPLEPPIANAYLAMGRGLYNSGEIDDGLALLRKSHQLVPSAEALEHIATIELKRKQYAEAARDFSEVAAMPRESPHEQLIEKARLRRLAGEAYLGAGDGTRAKTLWTQALDEWDLVLGTAISARQRSAVYIERGRLLWALGQETEAVRSFEAAIDAVPEGEVQSSIYSDVIAFLMPRGAYDAALDTYLRSLARPAMNEYFKIYTSLWIVGMARLRGIEPDSFAMDYLAQRKGTRWYHELAKFATGQQTWDELFAKANTRGKRAEAYFYQAIELYAKGDRAGGDKLMQYVLDTDMLGFFEFDMAAQFLRGGPPKK